MDFLAGGSALFLSFGLLSRSSLVIVLVLSEFVNVFGVASRLSGHQGAFDFSGEVRFALYRPPPPDRNRSVSSTIRVSGQGFLDFDGLEF